MKIVLTIKTSNGLVNESGISLQELREFISALPDKDEDGKDLEVWIYVGNTHSSPLTSIVLLNGNDVLLGTE